MISYSAPFPSHFQHDPCLFGHSWGAERHSQLPPMPHAILPMLRWYVYLEAASPTENAQMFVCCGVAAWFIKRNTCLTEHLRASSLFRDADFIVTCFFFIRTQAAHWNLALLAVTRNKMITNPDNGSSCSCLPFPLCVPCISKRPREAEFVIPLRSP